MKSVAILLGGGVLLSFVSVPVLRQETPKPPEPPKAAEPAKPQTPPAETDAATLEFLKKVDEVHFNYPGAGVHSLTFKMKVGGNPMMPPEMREKMKDAALVYYWQEEPWKEAIDMLGLPPEMAAMKGNFLAKGVAGLRQLTAHSYLQLAKHYTVVMSKDGDMTKLDWTPKDAKGDFVGVTLWFDRNTKLTRGQSANPKDKKLSNFDFTLVPLGTKYAIAEIKQAAAEGGAATHIEWGKQGELAVPVKLMTSSGPMKLEFPLELEANPKLAPAIFEKKP